MISLFFDFVKVNEKHDTQYEGGSESSVIATTSHNQNSDGEYSRVADGIRLTKNISI